MAARDHEGVAAWQRRQVGEKNASLIDGVMRAVAEVMLAHRKKVFHEINTLDASLRQAIKRIEALEKRK